MISSDTTPRHLGLILDGNRRWARAKGLPTLQGHKAGYDNLKTIARHVLKIPGIDYLSAFAFSAENWQRSKEEVTYLMDFALRIATHDVRELHKENIRVRFLGSKDRLSGKLLKAIQNAEELTRNNTGGTLALCFNYGGQQELVDAVRQLLSRGLKPDEITEDVLANVLYAPDVPAVDLVIRTSGEQRTSGFMLYRAAYSELYFTDTFWPDFSPAELDEVLEWYAKRQRRFGS